MRVLYFTKSSGYEHSVIKEENGQPSHSGRILTDLCDANGIALTLSKDGSLFSPEYFAGFDAVVFYTSGYLLKTGTDGNPPMTDTGKQALLDAVAGGMGFLAIHSGGDTFHTMETEGGNPKFRGHRYELHGETSDPYIRMLGGEFVNHGKQQIATATVPDPHFPGCGALGGEWTVLEEWYSNKEFADDLHVLLVMQTATMEGIDYQRPPYPLAWARNFGKGRVWFNGMGHREDIWETPEFQGMLLGGLQWAGRAVDADITPNIAALTPDANTLPPQRDGVG